MYVLNNSGLIQLIRICRKISSIINYVQSMSSYIFETNIIESFNRKLPQFEKLIKDRDLKIKELQQISAFTLKLIGEVKKEL